MFKIKRNKLNRQEAFNFEKRSQFGIRKLTIGVVSLVIGSGMVLSGVEQVQAGTDYDPGVEIRYVRNGSPKALASDGDFKIEKSFVEVNGVQYVDVTLTFNQDHDGYARRFLYFNMPKSLYEPEKITRELYWQGERTPRETTEYRTWQGDYRFADEPWYRLWDHRYIIGSPDSLQGERHKKVTSPTDPGGDTIGGQSEGRWNGDWDRLMFSVPNNAGSGKEALTKAASDFKATSRTVYINRFSGSTDKHVYKFRARVKDGNAPMNFVVGLNEESGSHANFLAQYGTTPDTRTLAEKSTINPPARIGVNSLQDLSQQTRNNIAQKIREANPDLFNGAGPLVTNVTVSSDGIGGNAVLRFKDGSEKTIPMKQLVYKINTASGAAPTAPSTSTNFVLKGRGVVGNEMVGLQGEDHQLNLPAKKAVANIATIGNKATYLTQWQEQLNKFLELNKQLQSWNNQWGFKNGARTFGPDNWKAQHLTASIKYTDSRQTQIQGIEVKGVTKDSRFGGPVNTQVYGLLTPAMLFYQEDPLKTTKDEAKATIDSIGNINGKAADWKSRIDAAQNQQAIEAIITEARNEKNALDKKKAAAIQEINALPHLSQNEKTAAINAINSATTTTVVDQKLNDAKALNTTNMRNKGKEAINALSKLNDGEKTPYRNRIDNATTQDQINAIIEEAAFEDLKRSALEQLDNMNPAPSNKDELRAQITETNFNTVSSDGKKPAERIEAILERAKAEVLRDQARRDINAISGLPEEKKNEFLGIVDRAQTPSEITNAVDQARAYSDYIQAKDAINQLTNINNKQKEELLAGLERDKSQQGVADMLTSARALDGEMKHLKDLVAQAETIKQSSDYSRADRAKQNTFNTALDAAKRVSPQTGELPTTSVGQLISNLTDAIRGLGGTTQPVTKDVDKGNLRAEIDRSTQVKDPANAEYTYASDDKKQAYEAALTKAREVYDKTNPAATQDEVDEALNKLQTARIALDGHAPERVVDQTPPSELGGARMTNYSDVQIHGVSTIGKKIATPETVATATEADYGTNTTGLVEMIVIDNESAVDPASVTFKQESLNLMDMVGIKFVPYSEQKENKAIGYFTTKESDGTLRETGAENIDLKFTVANVDNARSSEFTFMYNMKDDIPPVVGATEHVLIKDQDYTINVSVSDNSLFGTDGNIDKGSISIKVNRDGELANAEPRTPVALGITNGHANNAWTVTPTNPQPFSNRGARSNNGTLSFSGRATSTLSRTTYQLRVADSNKGHSMPENLSFTDITFTVVDRLAAPADNAKVSVNNPSRLTEDEKNAIKQAVRTANPHIAAIDGNAGGVADKQVKIDVANDGRVTVTYPHGGKQDTLTADQVLRVNQAPVADVNNFGPMRNIPGNAIPDGGTRNRPTVFVFAKQAISNDGRATKTRQELEAANMGYLPITDPDNDALKEVAVTNFEGAPLGSGLKVASNGTLSGNAFTTVSPGGGWVARIVPKDAHDKLGNPVYFHIRAYTDKLIDPTQANPVEGTYNQAVTAEKIFEKLTIDAPIGNSSITVPDGSNPDEKAQYTRTITGYKTTENGEVTTVDNGVAGLPKQGTYFAEVTTTNIWGQTIKNYVKVVHQEDLAARTDLVAPEAVQVKGTTVAEDEKQTIIDALKAANPGKLPDDPSSYSVAPNGTVTVTYSDNSSEPIDVPLKSGIPTVTAQPHDIVVFKNTDMTTPVELAGFTDNESIKDIQIVGTDGSSLDQMGLTVDEKAKENNVKSALISGKTNSAVGKHTRKLRALDNLDQASAATNDFSVRIVDATVNQPETAITKEFGQALTPEEVRSTINFNVGSGQNNLIDFDVVIPADAPTSGKNVEVPVIIRTKAHASASEEFKRTFVSQDKTVTVRATWPTQADNIEVTAPADTTPVLIDGARPTSEADKTALIDALKEANKTPEGTSKFPENTRFDVAENGAVTITYPDRSSETVTVPFKQKDSAQHAPTVAETPINSAATAGTPLTEDERNAVKAAVTVPNFPGDRQPTVTVPENARVTDGTNGNTGKLVVVATVEYPDGSSETVEVPVRQRDTAKHDATVTNPETPAAIKASHASDTAITDDADKNAILAKVAVPDGSNGRPSLDQNPVVETREGKQVVKVTVTYPDQTTDTVYVPVDQKDNETHNPTAPAESVKLDAPATANSTLSDDDKAAVKAAVTVPDGSRGEVSLPEGAKVELVGDKPVVKATVTYPDGTTETVDVPVVQKDSTKHTPVLTEANSPVLTDTPAKANEPVQEVDKTAIAGKVDKTNLPQDTEVKVPDNAVVEIVDGKPVVPVEINYPDGTSETIKVPIDQKDDLTYTPVAPSKDKPVAITASQTPGTQITDPADIKAILDSVTVPAVDGKEAGEVDKEIVSAVQDSPDGPYVTVKVTYPDGTSETVQVPVNQKDNETYNPTTPTAPVQVDAPAEENAALSDADKQAIKSAVQIPDGSNGVASLPEDAKVELVDGKPVVPVTVTYPDNTTDTVYVPVVQKDSVKHTPSLTDADQPVLTNTPAKAETPVQDADKEAIAAKVDLSKLPENTTAKVPDGAKVELDGDKPVVPVLVSYPDGTSEIIKVPVDQKDSETYKPTAPAAEAPVAITGSDAPDAPIAEADKPAILNSVTVPAVDGGQAPEVTKEITSPVKVVDGKAFVEVTVTYPDKTSEVISVPVNQKDNEANTPTVTAPEKPAPISVPVAENTPVETDADKKLITDKVNVAGLPNPPQSVKVAEPAKVVLDQAGNPVVNVEVTYPDGTKDIVPVPVKQADNQTNTPSLKDPEVGKPAEVLVAIDPTPGVAINNPMDKEAIAAKVDLSKLPAGTTAEVADGAVVANDPLTNKPVVPVTVTYPDGTSEIINVPVKQADNLALDPSLKDTNPVPILTEATVGLMVSDKANLDAIAAKVDPKTGKAEVVNNTIVAGKEDGPHAGQPVVNVLVTYPDDTQDTIEVPVKQADNVANEPSLTDQTPVPIQAAATTGTLVPADDKPAILAKVNLPAGAEATIADDATVVREDGQAVVPVTVTYPDGTTDTISVPVKRADNSKYTPSQVTDTVQVDAATAPGTAITSQDDKDAIIAAVTVPKVAAGEKAPVVSLPENPQVEVVNAQPVVKAIVTYADGTTDTVDVPIVQKVSATKEPSLKETEPGKPAQAVITENPTAGASITDPADQNVILDKVVVPEGGKASIADDAVVEMDGDQPVLPVTVTYTDGSKDIIKVPVKQADNVAKEPSLKSQTPVGVMDAPAVGAQVEEPADLEAIKNNVDTKGGTASIEDPTIVEGPNNQPAVAVTVTYPDGTADTILVPIKTADNVTYTPVLKSTDPVLVSVATDNGTAVPEADQAKILANVDVPALTADGDKPAVDLSIENPVVLQKNGQAGVEVTVTYQDGSKDKIFVPVDSDTDKDGFSNKEEEKAGTNATDPSSTPAGQDSAGRLNPSLAEPVEVKNPDKLSDAEKETVKDAVKESNDLPEGTEITVSDNGTVTVTYPDKSTDTIEPNGAVTQFVDKDGDGISDRQETENGTDPSKVDSDNDGFSDKEEGERGTDPTKADSKPASSATDTDGDGISNEDEVVRGTDPNKSDSDGDGFSDQEEITAGSNPTKADSTPANVDKDGDGFTDTEEAAAGTDATNPSSTPAGQDSAGRLNPSLAEPVEVKNPDKLSDAEKEAVKDAVKESNDLPAGTEITVSDNGTVTVTYPDKSTDTIEPADTVKVAKDTDKDGFTDTEEEKAGTNATDPSSTPAGQDSAGQLTPGLGEPVEVKNPDKLSDAEKEAVRDAVQESNDLPAGTEITVSDNGTVTVTYPDESTDTIQPAETVKVAKDTDKDGFTDTEEEKAGTNATDPSSTPAGQDSAGQLTPGLGEPVEVKNPDKLSDAEKEAIKKAVEDSNDLPEGTEVSVSDNGTVTVTYPDKSTDTIQPAETVKVAKDTDKDGFTDTEEEKAGTNATDPSSTPAGQDSAGQLTPGLTEPVEVKNPDKLTDAEKDAVKKAVEDSNDLPEGTEVTVSDNGTVTVTYPDKSTDTIQPAETVKVAKDTDKDGFTDTEEEKAGTNATDPSSTPAGQDSAGQLTPSLAEPVEVKNPDKLTDAEKESVKKAVEDSNDLPEGTEVTVSDNGTVTVTYPDKSTDTIQPAETVKVAKDTDKDGFTDTEEATAGTSATDPASTPDGQDSAGQLTPSLAEPVEVKNPDKLTDAEKESVKKAVEDSNDLPEGTEVSVSDNGTVTVTYPDKSTDTIQPAETVKVAKDTDKDGFTDTEEEKAGTNATDPSSTPAGQDSAGQLTPSLTEPVEVKNPDKLTDAEKEAVKKAVEDSNDLPEGTEVTVSDNGTVTVTYPDKSADTIQPTDTVKAAKPVSETPVAPSKPEVTATDSGAVVVTPPTDNVTNLDITFTPEGASQPVTVVVSKDENGIWTAPADSGLVINSDGTITIPAEKVADGTAVTVVAENGSISSPEVGSTVVPVPAVTPETPVAPSKPEVTATDSGAVVVTPPTDNVTNLDITFTPEGSSQPVTVVVSKDATGTWTAPADSGLVVNPDGTITIPAENVADGTAVTVVAENGSVSSPEVGSAVVPVPTPELPAIPAKPTSVTNADGSVTIVPPVENVTGLDITFTPEGATEPVTVTLGKDATGAWTAPADSGLVVNPDGTITIPADKVADGTEGQVGLVAKNGDLTSNDPAPQVPETPAKSSVETNENGSVTIVPPVENVTGIDITFTPEGASQPVTVVVSKDATGAWTAPADSGLVVNPDGTITIPADKVADGTAVSVVTKNGQVPSDEASATYVPAKPASTDTPVVEVPATPSLALDGSGNVLITPPAENATSLDITFTPAGSETPITVTANKDATGNWILPETSIAVVNPDGTISISTSEMEGGTAVSVVAKNEGVPSSQAATVLVQPKQTAEELAPTVKKPIAVEDASKLTDAEKKELEDVVRKDNVLPEGTEVSVADDGTVTVTYPDKSTDTILPTKTVMDAQNGKGTSHSLPAYDLTADEDKDGFTNEEELKQGSNVADAKSVPAGKSSAERLTPTNDLAVKVKDLTKLSDAEKETVETAIRKDKDLPEGTQIEVANDGSVTITYPDGSIGRLPADQTVLQVAHGEGTSHSLPAYDLTADEDKDGFTNEEELKQGSNVADAKSVPAGKSSAERLTPTNDLAVKVKDLTKLTDAEKKAVETAIRKNNTLPEGTQIEVANDGSVTITYPDGSVDQIVATKVVATDSTVSPDSGVSQSSGTTKVLPGSASSTRAAKKPLPATGENGSPILVLSGLALLAGVAMFRKAKREDEN
ncbi:TPA: GA module-containing protein [Streptococcus suis]|nr:GA module-containing protein [Streptococcus suis]